MVFVRHLCAFILCVSSLGLLGACSSTPSASVSDLNNKESVLVQRGDTLYAIAWRSGMDFRELANQNGINPPYTIYPGQHIYLKNAPKSHTVVKQAPTWQPKKVATTTRQAPAKTPTNVATVKSTGKWLWPADGAVSKNFSAGATQYSGIDIIGKLGEPIRATADGQVVYSGSGLRGYGQLIIIKHSERYLSAYAHNRLLIVKEGDSVKTGQKIAEMGNSGTDKVKLHFEIREDGKPVNPLLYLVPR